jgi:erythronate-4-phosphate dehydrogenase
MKIVADENIPFVREAFGPIGQVLTVPGRQIRADLLADADVLLVRSITPVGRPLLETSTVRFVATATIGTDHLDKQYLQQRNIAWADAAGCNANSVAEYVVAVLLTLAQRGRFRLRRKTIGVVGVGNVGSRVVRYAQALGMNVLQNDPPLQRQTGDPRFVPLEQVFEADFVSFHVPLTRHGPDATWHMVDAKFLQQLKPETYLVNTSRGSVVDEHNLHAVLERGCIAGAVPDVWEHEPDINVGLLGRVELGTPHIAGYSFDGKVNGTKKIFEATCRHFGLSAAWDPVCLMPPPPHPRLTVDAPSQDEEGVVRWIVKQIYDVEQDDAALRLLARQPPEQRGSYFDRLRRDYRIRREFGNTELLLPGADPDLANKLRGLGFRIGSTI